MRTGEVLVYRIWVLSDLVLSQPVGCSSHCSSKERWSIKTLRRLQANCEPGAGCWRVSSTYSSRIFSTLAGGKIFSKLDLSQAYLQVPVDESLKPYLTMNTHAPRTYWNPWEVIPPMPVKSVQSCYIQHHFTLGYGQRPHGGTSTLILLVHFGTHVLRDHRRSF